MKYSGQHHLLISLNMEGGINHYDSHSKGSEIYCFTKKHTRVLPDFGKAVLTMVLSQDLTIPGTKNTWIFEGILF